MNSSMNSEKSKATSSYNLMRKYCLYDGCYNRGPRRSLGASDRVLHWGIWETWEYMNRDKVYGNTLRFISGSWELDATLF